MRKLPVALPVLFAILTLTGAALADALPGPKCKCSMPGVADEGSVAAAMLAGGGLLVAVSRSRRRARRA